MSIRQFIFTDCERGTGVDPNCSGYQVAACSEGLAPELHQLLSNICLHYGEVVYRYAPRASQDQEAAWRTTATALNAVPQQILDQFPVVWSYDRLQDNVYALTGVKYCGLTHDRRVGNFLAHSLVFAPEALAPYADNPLALRTSESYFAFQPGDQRTLPTLSDLGVARKEEFRPAAIATVPFCDQLGSLVGALATATPDSRPLIVCVRNWRQAAPLIEELLMMLPPSARRRTSVSTFEGDRAWLPTTRGGRGAAAAAHHLLVLVGADGRAFNLRPDEYQSMYRVFNFVDNQFSDLGEVNPYADFAARTVKDNAPQRLAELQKFIERLEAGRHPSTWDKLTCAADLRCDVVPVSGLTAAVFSIADVVGSGPQAEVAFDWVMPHIERLAGNNQFGALSGLASPAAKIFGLLPKENGARDFRRGMVDLATQAYSSGRIGTAGALLDACGADRDRLLREIVIGAQGDVSLPKPTDSADRELLVKLLREVLKNLESPAELGDHEDAILVATFAAAAAAGNSSQVWAELSDGVARRLDGSWNEHQQNLAQQLLQHLSADNCPTAVAFIATRRLEAACPEGAALTEALADASRAAARSDDAEKSLDRLLAIAREKIKKGPALAVTLGIMAEATCDAPVEALLRQAYNDAVKSCGEQRDQIRRRLAEYGAVSVLTREMASEVLPWDRKESPKRFDWWWDKILSGHSKSVAACCGRIAGWLQADGNREQFIPLAEALLGKQQVKKQTNRDVAELLNGLILALPVGPLSDRQERIFSPPPNSLAAEAKQRLRLLALLRELESQASQPDWTLVLLPFESEDWKWCLQDLSAGERKQVLRWCLDKLATTGLSTPQEAEALVRVLKTLGETSVDVIVESFCQLLDARDPVTDVIVGTAIARCHLEERGPRVDWSYIVKGLAERFEKNTRRLFEDHLLRRFCRSTPAYQKRLRELCDVLGVRYDKLPRDRRDAETEHDDQDRQRGPAEKRGFFDRLIGR